MLPFITNVINSIMHYSSQNYAYSCMISDNDHSHLTECANVRFCAANVHLVAYVCKPARDLAPCAAVCGCFPQESMQRK